MPRGEKNTALEQNRPIFVKLSNKWGLTFKKIIVPIELRKKLMVTLHFSHNGTTKMLAEARQFWWPNISKNFEHRTKCCVSCLASGKNLNYQILKNETGKLKTSTEPGQETQTHFSGNLNNQTLNDEHQILIAVDRFSKWLTVKICKSSETKEVLNFLTHNFNLYGPPDKIMTDKVGAFISNEYEDFCKSPNIEIEYSTQRLHTGTGAVDAPYNHWRL